MKRKYHKESQNERLEDLIEAPGLKPQLAAGDIPHRVGRKIYRKLPIISEPVMHVAWDRLCALKPEYRAPKFGR